MASASLHPVEYPHQEATVYTFSREGAHIPSCSPIKALAFCIYCIIHQPDTSRLSFQVQSCQEKSLSNCHLLAQSYWLPANLCPWCRQGRPGWALVAPARQGCQRRAQLGRVCRMSMRLQGSEGPAGVAGVHWFNWLGSQRSAHTGLQGGHLFGCSDCRGSSASSQPCSGAGLVLWRSWGSTSSTREAAEGFHVHLFAGWELRDFLCIALLGDPPASTGRFHLSHSSAFVKNKTHEERR